MYNNCPTTYVCMYACGWYHEMYLISTALPSRFHTMRSRKSFYAAATVKLAVAPSDPTSFKSTLRAAVA